MICHSSLPHSFLQVIHPWIMLLIHLLAPIIHKPLALIAPSVKRLPWCFTATWWWRMSSVVMWCLPGIRRGLASWLDNFDSARRPPTCSRPFLSITGWSLWRELLENKSRFGMMHLISSEYTLCWTHLITVCSAWLKASSVRLVLQRCKTGLGLL